MEIKKPVGQIIRDAVIRKRRMSVSLGLFSLTVLLILGVPRLQLRGAAATAAFVLTFAPAVAGCAMGIASARCPICDYAIYKSGACKCQPNHPRYHRPDLFGARAVRHNRARHRLTRHARLSRP